MWKCFLLTFREADNNEKQSKAAVASVAMVHCVPELVISEKVEMLLNEQWCLS